MNASILNKQCTWKPKSCQERVSSAGVRLLILDSEQILLLIENGYSTSKPMAARNFPSYARH